VQQLPITDARWLAFVRGRPDATPFHDPAWAALLGECYDMPVCALALVDESGAVRAGMPVAAAPRLLGRSRRLVSLPFTDAIVPLVGASDVATFVQAADTYRQAREFTRIELRGELAGAEPAAGSAVIHSLSLTSDPEELLRRFSKGKRRDIRASERSDLRVRRAERETDVTETFYRLHVDTRRRHGVPVQPKRFFRLLWHQLLERGLGFSLIAEQGGEPVASAIFLIGGGQVVYKYAASDAARRSQLPNDLLIWNAIKQSCRDGLTMMDFGRSELTAVGLRAFKSRWGTVESPLTYSTIGAPATPSHRAGEAGVLAGVLRRSPRLVTRVAGEVLYRYAA
jgi:CelD/BcsL family acetyltransferase involved in cellulose biosynthesis